MDKFKSFWIGEGRHVSCSWMEGWEERSRWLSGECWPKFLRNTSCAKERRSDLDLQTIPHHFPGPSSLITTTIVFSTYPKPILSYALLPVCGLCGLPGHSEHVPLPPLNIVLSRHKHETRQSPQRDATILLTQLPSSSCHSPHTTLPSPHAALPSHHTTPPPYPCLKRSTNHSSM